MIFKTEFAIVCLLLFAEVAHAQPNVLMIVVDDMNDWVGCLDGHPDAKMPNIDRLAQRGMLFTNAHVAAPVCNPSRVATLTGRRPSTTGIYDNSVVWHQAMPDTTTIPGHFKANGYHVVGGGKVNHHMPGFNRRRDWHEYFDQVFDSHYDDGLARGLDVRNFSWPQGFPLNQLPAVKSLSKPPQNAGEFDWGAFDKSDAEMGDGKMIDWAAKFLADPPSGKPFFLAAGRGFDLPESVSTAPVVIEGSPPDIRALDIATTSGSIPKPDGNKSGKVSGVLMNQNVLYAWVRNLNPPGKPKGTGSTLMVSRNLGKDWTFVKWSFPNIGYLDRIRTRLAKTRDAGVFMSVMLFEGYGVQFQKDAWPNHPMNPLNNINDVDGDKNGDGKGIEIHQLARKRVTRIQEAYLRWLITGLNEFDNLLFEVSNETHPSSTEWQYHVIRFVKEVEKSLPNQHPVGMTCQNNHGVNQMLWESPADWISPNREGSYRDNPPDGKGIKVVISDTDHPWGVGGDATWVWKSVTRGLNPIFMDTYDGKVLGKVRPEDEAPRKAMGRAIQYAHRMNLARATPQNELSSTGFCLAEPGVTYLVFAAEGGNIEVDLTAGDGPFAGEWRIAATDEVVSVPPV